MALRDWHGWQIGMLWAVGVGFLWLLGRIGETMTRGGAAGRGSGIGSRIGLTAVILLVVAVLLVVTLRWFRGRLLDDWLRSARADRADTMPIGGWGFDSG